MAMTHDEMVALIRRLEHLPPAAQASYRRKLALLAALGYAYVMLLLLLALGAVVAIIVLAVRSDHYGGIQVRAVIVLGAFAVVVVRALWVKIERPKGTELGRDDAPELFEQVRELSEELRAPAFDHIVLTSDYNAGVVQYPRLGPLGWQENYLLVGLPYMQATTPGQFRATLAHEIGHLSANHGRFGVWIWRLDATWERLTAQVERQGFWAGLLVKRFARWYGPYFHAYAFVQMRQDEREADRYAAELVGAREAAEDLAVGVVWGKFLEEEFWPRVYQRVNEEAEPPGRVFSAMMAAMGEPLPPDRADTWLVQALAVKTGYDDTHPSLAERLAAVGYGRLEEDQAARAELLRDGAATTAASRFLGERVAAEAARFDGEWKSSMGPAWAERRRAVEQAGARLAELARRGEEGTLSPEEAWEEAHLTAEFGDRREAIALLRKIAETRPAFTAARYALGAMLLGEGDESGVALVEGAIQEDEEFLLSGCQAMHEFFQERGRQEEAEACESRARQRYHSLAKLQQRKLSFERRDALLPPTMPAEYVEQLRQLLAGLPEVAEGYLVRKQAPDSGKEFHVLGVVPRFRGLVVSESRAVSALLEKLELPNELPMEFVYVVIYGGHKFLRRRMQKVEGSLIYKRERG